MADAPNNPNQVPPAPHEAGRPTVETPPLSPEALAAQNAAQREAHAETNAQNREELARLAQSAEALKSRLQFVKERASLLKWTKEENLVLAVDQAQKYFNSFPTNLPEYCSAVKTEWMDAFGEEYLNALSNLNVANNSAGLQVADVIGAAGDAQRAVGDFETWLTANKPEIAQRLNTERAAQKAAKEAAEAEAKRQQAEQARAQEAERRAAAERAEQERIAQAIAQPKAETLLQADSVIAKCENLPVLKAKITELRNAVEAARNPSDLKAAQTAYAEFVTPAFADTLANVSSGLSLAKTDLDAHSSLAGPAESQVQFNIIETFKTTCKDVADSAQFPIIQTALTTVKNKVEGVAKLAKAVGDSVREVPQEVIAKMMTEISEGKDPNAVLAEFNTVNQQETDAINKLALSSKPSFADRIQGMIDKAQPGAWKDALISIMGFMRGIGEMLSANGFPGASIFMTSAERFAANDPETVYTANSRLHMLNFRLPPKFVDKYNDQKVSDVIEACTTHATTVDDSEGKVYVQRMKLFAATLKREATKVDGGMDKTVAEVMGNPDLKGKINYKLPRGSQRETPPTTPTTAPGTAPSGAPNVPPVAPSTGNTPPPAGGETPTAENLEARYGAALKSVLTPLMGQTKNTFEFQFPYKDGVEVKNAPCKIDVTKGEFCINDLKYRVDLPFGASITNITINRDSTVKLALDTPLGSQERIIPTAKIVEILDTLRGGNDTYSVTAGNDELKFKKVS